MSIDVETGPITTVFDPGVWTVRLKGGGDVLVRADGYFEEGGSHVFTVLAEGPPDFMFVVASFPDTVVEEAFGGPHAVDS